MNQQSLPPGWTEHESSSHPGHKYYFNSVTGCKTWNREDLIGWTNSNGNVSSQAKVDDNNIDDQVEIRQLEMLLANKKKEQETVSWNSKCIQRTTHSLRSDLQSGTLENSKDEGSSRQKIVFDLKNNERRRDVNENVVHHHSHVHEKSQNKDACVGKEGVENEVMESGNEILNNSSDSSLYGIDDDEIEELEKIKSKYASPPKSTPSDQTNTVLQDEEKSSAPSDKINPIVEVEEKLTATIECLGNQSSKYLPENYGFQYVNYQNEPKEKYQRVYKPRDRPVLKKLKGNFQDKPLASSTVKESIIASNLDRTPEQNLDTTPVYGSLDDSVDRELDVNYHGAGSNSSSTFEEKICDSSLSLDQSTGSLRSSDGSTNSFNNFEKARSVVGNFSNSSYEGDRPPTPPLVIEMQEEECDEWESEDKEEIFKETMKIRTQLTDELEIDDIRLKEIISISSIVSVKDELIVVDTNVAMCNLDVVNQVKEENDKTLVIPWMMIQELDLLNRSEVKAAEVRARAASRWILNSLRSDKCQTYVQTAEESRYASSKFESKTADDKILAACLQFKEKNKLVTLLTNDSNLVKKATQNGISCADVDTVTSHGSEGSLEKFDESLSERKKYSELVLQGKNTTRDLLETVLRKEFKLKYGDKTWEKMLNIKPKPSRPYWSLSNLFSMYQKYHVSVFGLVFPSAGHGLKTCLVSLKEKIKKTSWAPKDVKIVLGEMSNLIEMIKARDSYEGIVDICSDKISDILSQLEDYIKVSKSTSNKLVVNNVVGEKEAVQELFQSVWEIIACFTRGFATALSIHNTMPKFEPDIQFQSESYASRNLPTFFTLVSSLQEAMLNVVSAGGSGHHLHTFHSLLTQFRTNLELDQSYWPPFDKVITPPQLEKFLTDEDNEHIVRGGLEQISEFRQLLIKCISRNEHQAL